MFVPIVTLPSTLMSVDQSFDLVLNSKSNDLFINGLSFKQGEDELNIDGTKNIFPSIYGLSPTRQQQAQA